MPTAKTKTVKRRRRRSAQGSGILATVQAAREAAANAMRMLRDEIRQVQARLEKLMESERSFRMDLFGGSPAKESPRAAGRGKPAAAARQKGRRKGPPIADRFFKQLPNSFTLDDIRKVAGRLTGVSLAQWGRSKKIRKTGKGKYQKAA